MNTLQKPLRMQDLPGKVYRCDDEAVPTYKPKNLNSFTQRLLAMEINDQIVIPKTSAGLISRVSRKSGMLYTTCTVDNGANLRVMRIK